MGERASNVFGVLLSLTFFSVLLAVMLVAVSVLPDGPTLAPPTLPGETRSRRPLLTPQPGTLGELGLAPAPALVPAGAALASVTFTTAVIPPPAGPSGPGGGTVSGPARGPDRDGFGPGRAPTGPSRAGDGKAGGDRALEKAKSLAERAKDRSERAAEKAKNRSEKAAEKAKNRAEKVRERGKEGSGSGRSGEAVQATKPKPSRGNGEGPPFGKGRGKGKKR